MKVSKFGGTSLADADRVRKVCEIVASDADRRIIVVSAPGKRRQGDIKVTDLLIACGRAFLERGEAKAELDAVVDRFCEIQRDMDLAESIASEIAEDLERRLRGDASDPGRFLDALKAGGEDNCARLMAEALCARGLNAHRVSPKDAGMILSDEYGNACVLPESYKRLAKLRHAPGVSVFPGFFGHTKDGAIATFPRGGSDITGAIISAAVKADLYENFTDVDSVFAADPRIVENPQPISELTYHEMRELSYSGFDVFHDEAVLPAVHARVPISIKSTIRPEAPGTMILPQRQYTPGEAVGIAGTDGFCTIFLEKYLMNRMVGFVRRLLQVLEEENLAFEHAPSGIDNVSVILREEAFTPEVEQRVLARLSAELTPDDVRVERGLALVMIVGEGMRHAIGVANRAAKALADAGVNIEMINQGASEISMMFGVKSEDCPKAVRALYGAFFGQA